MGSELRYWVALDAGQSHDYSAALVVKRVGPLEELHVTSLSRAPLRTPYPAIARAVVAKCCELEPVGAFGERYPVGLVVDAGGVGRAVADLVKQEIRALGDRGPKIKFWPVNATGGGHVNISGGFINVPKRDLITAAVVALQDGRLKIGDLPGAELLISELKEYRQKLTARQNITFEGAGRNDDLVSSLALATWAWSQTRQKPPQAAQRAKRDPTRSF